MIPAATTPAAATPANLAAARETGRAGGVPERAAVTARR